MINDIPLRKLAKADLQKLIDDEVAESKTLEFKEVLKAKDNKDNERGKLMSVICSFANTNGGDVVFGIRERKSEGNTGIAEALVPITTTNSAQSVQTLANWIRDHIEPRVRHDIHAIEDKEGSANGHFVVLRIEQSVLQPHMVTGVSHAGFYFRTAYGTQTLDIHAIRSAFLATDSQAERIKQFRRERLQVLMDGSAPATLADTAIMVIHVLPMGSFLRNERIDISNHSSLSQFEPPGGTLLNYWYNADGFISSWRMYDRAEALGYCQVFRNGAIEGVHADFLHAPQGNGVRHIASIAYEEEVIRFVLGCLRGFSTLSVPGPYLVCPALLGCKGAHLSPKATVTPGTIPIERNLLLLPEVELEGTDYQDNSALARDLRPIFDALWNACGYPSSENFNKNGDWEPF